MTCKKALELIYLSRDGELTSREIQDLEHHLQSCRACSQERVAANALNQHTALLRNVTPVSSDESGLTHSIMRSIRRADNSAAAPFTSLWNMLVATRFRLALGLALFIVGGIFLLQTDRDARRIAALEERLSRSNPSRTTILDFREAEALLPLAGSLGDLAEAIGKVFPGVAHRGETGSLVDSLARSSSDAEQHRTTFGQFLLRKYPKLATVRLDDGLNQNERDLLNSEGTLLLKDLEALIRKGEVRYEHQ